MIKEDAQSLAELIISSLIVRLKYLFQYMMFVSLLDTQRPVKFAETHIVGDFFNYPTVWHWAVFGMPNAPNINAQYLPALGNCPMIRQPNSPMPLGSAQCYPIKLPNIGQLPNIFPLLGKKFHWACHDEHKVPGMTEALTSLT
jgi:hypothetical protein